MVKERFSSWRRNTGTLTTLVSFSLNAVNGLAYIYYPAPGLAMDSSGNLYGTAEGGVNTNAGAIFEVTASSHVLKYLAGFNGSNGAGPVSGVVIDGHGNLFGTTESGGGGGLGTVFELAENSQNGAYPYGITDLVSFSSSIGASPSGLVLDSVGNLYGTTDWAGSGGAGTAFEVTANVHTLATFVAFNGSNGGSPHSRMAFDSFGDLFGTTSAGNGTIFEIIGNAQVFRQYLLVY